MKEFKNIMANQRREKILELLREDGSAKVINLSRIFKVSEVIIHQDLEKLEKDGLVTREHGGAYLKEIESQVRNFTLMNQANMDKKQRTFLHDVHVDKLFLATAGISLRSELTYPSLSDIAVKKQ